MMLTRSMNKEVKDIIHIFYNAYPQHRLKTTINMHLNQFKNFMHYQQRVKMSPCALNYWSKRFISVKSSTFVWLHGDTLGHQFSRAEMESFMCLDGWAWAVPKGGYVGADWV